MSISLGCEGAVPGVLVLVAAAAVALSVITVPAFATMNDGLRGDEVLIYVPRAHSGIVERQNRFLRGPTANVLICRVA